MSTRRVSFGLPPAQELGPPSEGSRSHWKEGLGLRTLSLGVLRRFVSPQGTVLAQSHGPSKSWGTGRAQSKQS